VGEKVLIMDFKPGKSKKSQRPNISAALKADEVIEARPKLKAIIGSKEAKQSRESTQNSVRTARRQITYASARNIGSGAAASAPGLQITEETATAVSAPFDSVTAKTALLNAKNTTEVVQAFQNYYSMIPEIKTNLDKIEFNKDGTIVPSDAQMFLNNVYEDQKKSMSDLDEDLNEGSDEDLMMDDENQTVLTAISAVDAPVMQGTADDLVRSITGETQVNADANFAMTLAQSLSKSDPTDLAAAAATPVSVQNASSVPAAAAKKEAAAATKPVISRPDISRPSQPAPLDARETPHQRQLKLLRKKLDDENAKDESKDPDALYQGRDLYIRQNMNTELNEATKHTPGQAVPQNFVTALQNLEGNEYGVNNNFYAYSGLRHHTEKAALITLEVFGNATADDSRDPAAQKNRAIIFDNVENRTPADTTVASQHAYWYNFLYNAKEQDETLQFNIYIAIPVSKLAFETQGKQSAIWNDFAIPFSTKHQKLRHENVPGTGEIWYTVRKTEGKTPAKHLFGTMKSYNELGRGIDFVINVYESGFNENAYKEQLKNMFEQGITHGKNSKNFFIIRNYLKSFRRQNYGVIAAAAANATRLAKGGQPKKPLSDIVYKDTDELYMQNKTTGLGKGILHKPIVINGKLKCYDNFGFLQSGNVNQSFRTRLSRDHKKCVFTGKNAASILLKEGKSASVNQKQQLRVIRGAEHVEETVQNALGLVKDSQHRLVTPHLISELKQGDIDKDQYKELAKPSQDFKNYTVEKIEQQINALYKRSNVKKEPTEEYAAAAGGAGREDLSESYKQAISDYSKDTTLTTFGEDYTIKKLLETYNRYENAGTLQQLAQPGLAQGFKDSCDNWLQKFEELNKQAQSDDSDLAKKFKSVWAKVLKLYSMF
jgi:hypothetical protein